MKRKEMIMMLGIITTIILALCVLAAIFVFVGYGEGLIFTIGLIFTFVFMGYMATKDMERNDENNNK